MKKLSHIPFGLLALALVSGCERYIVEPALPYPEFRVTPSPNIGTIQTVFRFAVHLILYGDTMSASLGYRFSWDWNTDGSPDTDWLDSLEAAHTFADTGWHAVRFHIRSPDGERDSTTIKIYVTELVQITLNTSASTQSRCDWSRDGSRRIAFEWGGSGATARHIWVLQYPSGTPVQVTTPADPTVQTSETFPEWSPDGTRIAYLTEDGMWMVNLETGQVDSLVNKESGPLYPLAWSPDGSSILLRSTGGLTAYRLEERTTRFLPQSGSTYCWSPSSQLIAVYERTENADILRLIEPSAGTTRREYSVPACGSKLDWSSDGEWISLGFNGGLHVLNVSSGEVLEIQVDGLLKAWWPSWSEDGSMIVFEAKEFRAGRPLEIWAIHFPKDWQESVAYGSTH